MLYSKTIKEMMVDDKEKMVIDIRERKDFDTNTYPGAVSMPWEEFMDHTDELP